MAYTRSRTKTKGKWLKGVINSIARRTGRKFLQTRSRITPTNQSATSSSSKSAIKPFARNPTTGHFLARTHMPKRVKSNVGNSVDNMYSISMGNNPTRISNSQMQYIRDQLVPLKQFVKNGTVSMEALFGECQYYAFELASCADIITMANQIDSTDPNLKFNINSAQMSLLCQNSCTASCYLRVYEYIARHDVPAGLTSVDNIIRSGFAEQKGDHEITNTTYGGKLFSNPQFCTYFTIGNVKEIKLDQGEAITLNLADEHNKLINMQLLTNASPLLLRDYSRGYVIQIYGQIGRSVDEEKQITLIKPQVDVIQTDTYNFKPISTEASSVVLAGEMPSSTGNVNFVNSGSGAVAWVSYAGPIPT